MREIGHLHHIWFFVLALHLSIRNVWLESSPEVHGAHDCVDDGYDDEDDRDDSEAGQGFSSGDVAFCSLCVFVHPYELEEEVGKSPEVEGLGVTWSVEYS